MLETVKQTIQSLPDTSFADYYKHYMVSAQDTDIDNEIMSLVRGNDLTTHVLVRLISTDYKEMNAL